jgi:D-inositol-3-phosphate glycosyltransferase
MSESESPVRVAVVGPHAPYRGGIAHFTNRVCDELERQGFEVVRVSFSRQYPERLFPGKNQFEPVTAAEASDSGASVSPAAKSIPPDQILIDSVNPASWFRAARQIRDARVQAIVFMYWMPFFAPAYAAIARTAQKAGITTQAIVHNALPHERHAGDALLSRLFFSRCDAVCALSESVSTDFNEIDADRDIQVIPHPVYDHFGDPLNKLDARKQLGLDSDAPVLLFFGLIRKYKGVHVLLDALVKIREALPTVRLVLAGEFYDDVSGYRDQISTNGLSETVMILDRYIEEELVPVLFSAADVVVQPYLSATQSGVVQIAVHFEKPTIVTDVGGLAESVGKAGAGLVVPPNDASALVQAVEHFFEEGVDERLTEGVRAIKAASSWVDFVVFIQQEINGH